MAVTVTNKKGKKVTLLNPSEKGAKFAKELKQNRKRTNTGAFKLNENKQSIKLSDVERAYRGGYLDAQKDSAKAYKARQAKKNRR